MQHTQERDWSQRKDTKSSRERRKKREVNKAHEKKQVTTSETKTQMSKSKTQIVTIEGCKQDRKKNNKKKS